MRYYWLCVVLTLVFSYANAQSFVYVQGGLGVKVAVTLGTQELDVKTGLSGFGVLHAGAFSVEGNLNIQLGSFLRHYGINKPGVFSYIEASILAGFGKNANMLGSNIGFTERVVLYDTTGRGNFYGLGWGIIMQPVSGSLSKFNNRRGSFNLRFAGDEGSFFISFANDFRSSLMRGTGTDKGLTGQIKLGYTRLYNESVYTLATGFDLYTPEPDYVRPPRNPVNSDDGRKNVLYGTKPFSEVFHANLYMQVGYQSLSKYGYAKLGIDSPKIGAFVQNTLHDNFALYPRFGWPVHKNAKPYFELVPGYLGLIN